MVLRHALHVAHDRQRRKRVEPRRRLVEEHDRRRREDARRDREALALAARQAAQQAAARHAAADERPDRAAQPHRLDDLVDARLAPRRRPARRQDDARVELHHLTSGQHRPEVLVLRHIGSPAHKVRRRAAAVDEDGAAELAGRLAHREDVHERRLAGARGAHERLAGKRSS